MTRHAAFVGGLLLSLATVVGCGGSSATPASKPPVTQSDEAKKISDALAKLSPEDRKLAEEQKFCPESGELLGSMDTPIKVNLKNGKTVFVCCDGCVKDAEKDADATLKKVADLKA